MTAAEAEAVAGIESRCFAAPWSLSSLLESLANPMGVYYTARADGALAGYAGMYHIVDVGFINNVAVDAPFRRNGVGSALVAALVRYAGQNGLRALTLEARASNKAAIALYEGFGFRQAGIRKNYYTLPAEDALLLTMELGSRK